MTLDEIIRMAREAGIKADDDNGYLELWNFAKLVAAHEREKKADHEPVAWIEIERGIPMFVGFADNYKPNCDGFIPLYAAAVRARGLTKSNTGE